MAGFLRAAENVCMDESIELGEDGQALGSCPKSRFWPCDPRAVRQGPHEALLFRECAIEHRFADSRVQDQAGLASIDPGLDRRKVQPLD